MFSYFSHLTSITLLGVPVEIYLRGTQYWASALSLIIVTFLTAVIYLPGKYLYYYKNLQLNYHSILIVSLKHNFIHKYTRIVYPLTPLYLFQCSTNYNCRRVSNT